MFALERTPLGNFAIMFANRLKEPLAYEVGGVERLAFGREYCWAPTGHLLSVPLAESWNDSGCNEQINCGVGAVRIAVSDLQSMRRGGHSEGTSYGYKNG